VAHLYGRDWTKAELLARVGDVSQVGGARLVRLQEGPEDGVLAAQLRTGAGLSFTVLPGRGMDIGEAHYNGVSLCWRSPTGEQHPAFYEPPGQGWLRGFYGGLMVTCGLTTAGWPSNDEGQELGLHGRASYLPARNVHVDGEWQDDEYVMWVQGRIREAVPYGENVQLTRRVWARLGERRLFVEDVVENMGHDPTPHMIAYHVNPGFPILDEGSELRFSKREVTPVLEEYAAGLPEHARFPGPTPGWKAEVYHHRLQEDGTTALFNPRLGLGLYVKQRMSELPWMWQWKQTGPGLYVVGMEPANCQGSGRANERARGALEMLQPGERREYHLEIGVTEDPSWP
jgi:hypothetical protein